MPTRNPFTKVATGDVQTFEDSLATIGRSYLTPKAPGLFKHEIGFQVLDQSDDNRKAVGVFGFRVGKRLLYVPMFYKDGVVKGTEQLRDPKRKIAVPLSDEWVNKFLSERGDEPPELRSRSASKDTALPSLWQLKYPPTKYASWAGEVVKDLARAIGTKPKTPEAVDLVKVASAHPELLAELGRLATTYTWFSDALARYHGREKIAAALATAETVLAARPDPLFARSAPSVLPPKAEKRAAVTVIRVRAFSLHPGTGGADWSQIPGLTPAEADELRGGRNAYRDSRTDAETSKLTWLGGTTASGERLTNVTTTGLYEVLVTGHKFEPCAVFRPLVGWGKSEGRCLVVRIKDNAWAVAHPNAVWVRGEAPRAAFDEWADGLQKIKDETDGVPAGTFAGLAKVHESSFGGVGYEATVPFTKCEGSDCAFPASSPPYRPYWAQAPGRWEDFGAFDPYRGHANERHDRAPRRVEVYDEAARPLLSGNQLYLPVGCKLIKLDGPVLGLGDGSDPERVLFRRRTDAGDVGLSAKKTAAGVVVHDHRVNKAAAFREIENAEAHLVEAHGLRPADARVFLAKVAKDKYAEALVKYATPDAQSLSTSSPNAPVVDYDQIAAPASFADDVVPSETSSMISVPIQDMLMRAGTKDKFRAYPTEAGVSANMPGVGNDGNPHYGSGTNDLDTVATAAASGRREVFDTAGLAALVKHKRLGSLLNEVRGPMGKLVTYLGDLLAHCYWNTDEWAEQYGESEVGPLEDRMLSQFEGLGELLLTLQEKMVGDDPAAGILPESQPNNAGETEG